MDALSLLLLYLSLALGVSFLCSLLEAGILSLPRSYIGVLLEEGRRSGKLLDGMSRNIDRPLAAILTLNTVAHTVGAAGAGAHAKEALPDALPYPELTTAFVLTALILIFSEILPKTLGAVYTKGLAGFTANALQWMIRLTFPLVVCFDWFNRLLRGSAQHRLTRGEVAVIARMGLQEGALHENEAGIIRNLLDLRAVRVDDILTPRPVLLTFHKDMTVREVLRKHQPIRFARIPIYGRDRDEIVGLVHRYRILEEASQDRLDVRMEELAEPVHAVPEHAPVATVLEQFVQKRTHLFQVVDEYGGTEGIVTLEDCLETLLGVEIVDETDTVADMRKLAQQRAAARRPSPEGS